MYTKVLKAETSNQNYVNLSSGKKLGNIARKSFRKQKPTKKTDIFEVAKLLNHKEENNKRSFLVRWKGYDSDNDTWEKESNLNCPRILKAYLKKRNIQ